MHRWSTRIAGAACAASVLVAAGCGGSKGPQVAQIGTTTTPTTSASNTSGSSTANPAAYSACMRKNGVTNFPDPDSKGRIMISGGVDRSGRHFGLDPNSPLFKRAQRACQKLSPKQGRPSAQEQAREKARALAFSACMRSHGVPNFPDPTFSPDGGTTMKVGPGMGNPNSPQFRKAQQACQKIAPGAMFGGPPPQS